MVTPTERADRPNLFVGKTGLNMATIGVSFAPLYFQGSN